MKEELKRFLATGTLICSGSAVWDGGTLPLEIKCCLGNKPPPLKYVSSVRAIVFRNHSVLVVRQENGHMYILPGGRREKGESLLETLRREILEETGWTLSSAELLGFMHFHHLGDKPRNYEYPYPDFLWPVYVAEAVNFVAGAKVPDKWVFESGFQPVNEVKRLPIDEAELLLLEAALKLR